MDPSRASAHALLSVATLPLCVPSSFLRKLGRILTISLVARGIRVSQMVRNYEVFFSP